MNATHNTIDIQSRSDLARLQATRLGALLAEPRPRALPGESPAGVQDHSVTECRLCCASHSFAGRHYRTNWKTQRQLTQLQVVQVAPATGSMTVKYDSQ